MVVGDSGFNLTAAAGPSDPLVTESWPSHLIRGCDEGARDPKRSSRRSAHGSHFFPDRRNSTGVAFEGSCRTIHSAIGPRGECQGVQTDELLDQFETCELMSDEMGWPSRGTAFPPHEDPRSDSGVGVPGQPVQNRRARILHHCLVLRHRSAVPCRDPDGEGGPGAVRHDRSPRGQHLDRPAARSSARSLRRGAVPGPLRSVRLDRAGWLTVT